MKKKNTEPVTLKEQARNILATDGINTEKPLFKLSYTKIQGHSHKKSNPPIPCQDSGLGGVLQNGFEYIIVSDGAGSSKQSHVASDFCVKRLSHYVDKIDFKELSYSKEFEEEFLKKWNSIAKTLFENTRTDLLKLAESEKIPANDLYCTMLLIIKTDWGFLSANIGDGRSGYSIGKPNALTVPLQTFMAGATFFLIKEGWDNVMRSYVTPIEDPNAIKYFFATTDGCQDFVMDRTQKGPRSGIYDNLLGDEARYDFNVPYEPFFDGLIASLNEVTNDTDRNIRLTRLIEDGIYVLNGEEKELKTLSDPILDDDKTFILFHK